MGASGSKECGGDGEAGQSSASDSVVRKGRKFRGSSVFGSSCIRLACRSGGSADSIQIPCCRNNEKNHNTQFVDQKDISDACNQSAHHSRSVLPRFNLFPSSLSFRMGRETGAGSSRDNNTSLTEFPIPGTEGEIYEGNESRVVATNGRMNIPELGTYRNQQDIDYTCDVASNDNPRSDTTVPTFTSYADTDSIPPQPTERRNDHGLFLHNREPIERNVRFSRSLSVGRLRDRVLRRSSASDQVALRLEQDEEVMNISSNRIPNDAERSSPSLGNNNISPAALSGIPQSDTRIVVARGHDHFVESPLPRESRFHDVLEHRSNFLDRRRRIRSQVRALQRLGNRFENLSGHERLCIISGHHRTGRCSCRAGTRLRNSNDDSTTRGSISRIVMLAEALFEVLDEMHQQSVGLSSQPSISSTGSVPAPSEVVESLPIKLHSKSQTHHSDDVAQCYVCLLEYEEGDKIRVLPCHHEFHKTCIDKWLKEIHRVCPLCRGNICRSGTSHLESQI